MIKEKNSKKIKIKKENKKKTISPWPRTPTPQMSFPIISHPQIR
jgi:hypothetical protein